MIEFVIFAVFGKLTIFILQRFPKRKLPWIGKYFSEKRFLGELFNCGLCLGIWVYSILAILCRYDITPWISLPILSWIFTGMATSFIVWVFSAGWNALFTVVEIGGGQDANR